MNDVTPQAGGRSVLGRLIDHRETYGAHVISDMIRRVDRIELAADIGAGEGRDLALIKALHPQARTVAVEGARHMADYLTSKGHEVMLVNIEQEPLPFEDGTVDLFIANQVIEHTKEVFWIFHQIARCLRPGGTFIMGVPNVLSLHNRVGALAGIHPTQHKLASAHVRPFSKTDTMRFLDACSPGTFSLRSFGGSQFYPFPKAIARPLSQLFPTAAFSIFFDLVKVGPYERQFIDFPVTNMLESSFYTGPDVAQRWSTAAE
jgi:SAM-dependent methyltransferase